MEPVVMILAGPTGSGKTRMLERFRDAHPGVLQLMVPTRFRLHDGEVFPNQAVDWENHAAIAVDEPMFWEPASLAAGVAELEAQAQANGKQLILVVQDLEVLARQGIRLVTEPLIYPMYRNSPSLHFDSRRLRLHAAAMSRA